MDGPSSCRRQDGTVRVRPNARAGEWYRAISHYVAATFIGAFFLEFPLLQRGWVRYSCNRLFAYSCISDVGLRTLPLAPPCAPGLRLLVVPLVGCTRYGFCLYNANFYTTCHTIPSCARAAPHRTSTDHAPSEDSTADERDSIALTGHKLATGAYLNCVSDSLMPHHMKEVAACRSASAHQSHLARAWITS
jgi:hypothetical protein